MLPIKPCFPKASQDLNLKQGRFHKERLPFLLSHGSGGTYFYISGGFPMFQLWGKLVKNNHILQDLTVCIDDDDTRTHKVFRALDELCDAWNLAKPIWLDTNVSEFQRRSKTRFSQDNFIESLDFDYLEIQTTEE